MGWDITAWCRMKLHQLVELAQTRTTGCRLSLMKLVTITHYQIHMTFMTLSSSWTFSENGLFWGRHYQLMVHCQRPSSLILLFANVAVYADGSICLDILQNRWSPTYDVSAILTSIQVTYSNYSVCRKKRDQMFSVISQTKLGRFWWNLTHGVPNKFAIKWCKRFPPHLNNVSTLPCKTWNAHCARATIEVIQKETPEFIPPQLWPPSSPDLSPVDYRV